MTAVFAPSTAISITASRLLYALSRERLAPRRFAQVDKNKPPWNAQALVRASCVVPPILIVIWRDGKPLDAFAWMGVAYVFFVLIPYTFVCVANIFYKNFLLTYLVQSTDFTTQSSIFYIGAGALVLLVGATAWGIIRSGGARAPHHFSEVEARVSA